MLILTPDDYLAAFWTWRLLSRVQMDRRFFEYGPKPYPSVLDLEIAQLEHDMATSPFILSNGQVVFRRRDQ